ncbi:hypothetical protein PENTCL1PPCAC_16518, partial [Pristionchus entomophagus]
ISILKLAYGSLIGHLITEGGNTPQCAIGAVISNIVDVGAFWMNIKVYYHCKRRNFVTHESTLNARYQLKEVYTVTRALLPVYCIGSIVKIPVVTITWLFLFDVVSYACSELVCTLACCSSCGVTSLLFMRFHKVIRGRVARIFVKSESDRNGPVLVVPSKNADETTQAYFHIMRNMWE